MSNYALTWQGQGASHIPMESTAALSNYGSLDRNAALKDQGTMANETLYRLVCSNRPRASTQTARGNQWWVREINHVTVDDGLPLYRSDHQRTLCGRDASEWLILDESAHLTREAVAEYAPHDLCKRCAAKL